MLELDFKDVDDEDEKACLVSRGPIVKVVFHLWTKHLHGCRRAAEYITNKICMSKRSRKELLWWWTEGDFLTY